MRFRVVCTLIWNGTRHHSDQNVEDPDSRGGPLWWRILFDIGAHTTLNHIHFVFHHNVNVKENVFLFSFFFFFFWSRSWHKERSSVEYNFPNQISMFPKISVSHWLLQQETAATRILHRAKRPQSWTFTRKNTTSFVPLLQISRQKCNRFAAKHTHWHLQWCSLGRSHLERLKHWSSARVTHWLAQNSSLPLPVRVSKSRVLKLPNDSRSVVSTLIYDGKLANQNARLVAIVTIYGGEQVSRVLVTSG